MNILVVFHSKTGTTRRFAELIAARLRDGGHSVQTVRLEVTGDPQPRTASAGISNVPDAAGFDAVLVGGPVWAFTATPVVLSCIGNMPGLADKTVVPFVTMSFPLAGMGGRAAIRRMRAAASARGAKVLEGSVVPRMFRDVPAMMAREAARIVNLFGGAA